MTIFATVSSAAWRTARDLRSNRAIELCWKSDFAELPESDRRCRHELAGRVISRTCDNAFDCRHCAKYSQFAVLPATGLATSLGLDYSDDRYYHRGHTWVKPLEDGTFTIGLDELAEHLIGDPDSVQNARDGRGTRSQSDRLAHAEEWKRDSGARAYRRNRRGRWEPEGRLVSEDSSATGSTRSRNPAPSVARPGGSRLVVAGTGATATATSMRRTLLLHWPMVAYSCPD